MLGAGLGLTVWQKPLVGGGTSYPSILGSGTTEALDSPSVGGDRGIIRIGAAPFDGGSPIQTLWWQVDSGSGYGAAQSTAWRGVADYPIVVLAGAAATLRVWTRNAGGDSPVLNLAPFTPTVSGAAGAPTVSATGLAPPALTAYREHTGTTTVDATVYFGAEAATSYVIGMPILGVSINSSTGSITIDHTLVRVGVYDLVVFKFNAAGVAHSETITLNILSPRTLQSPQRWGGSTPAGKGALNTNAMVGGPLANGTYTTGNYSYSVTGGIMTPLATATPGSYTIGGLDFVIFAGRTASTIAELQAAIADGVRVETRGPTAGGAFGTLTTADLNNRFAGFASQTTLANADTYDETLIRTGAGNFALTGSPTNLIIDGWNFRATTTQVAKDLSDMIVSTRYGLQFLNAVNCTVRNCAFTSNTPNAYMTGLRPNVGIPGIIVGSCDGLVIEDCYFTQLYNSVNIGNGAGRYNITIQRNTIWGMFADGLYSGASDGSGGEAVNLRVLNNDIAHWIGDHGFHSDGMQLAPTVSDRNCTGVVIRGNSVDPGLMGLLAPAWPTIASGNGYPALPAGKSTPRTASYTAGTSSFHHDVDPTLGAVTVQLPAQTVKTMNGIQKWGRSTNTVTVLPPAGTQILLGATLYDSITLVDPWEFMRFQFNTATGRYEAVAQTNAYQGVFTNAVPGTGSYVDIQVDHNLIGSTIAPANIQDTTATAAGTSWFVANTCIPPFPGRLLRSGRTNSAAQGFDPSNAYLITIGSNSVMYGNIGGTLTTGGTQENPGVNNYPMWQTAGGKTYAAINALFPATSQDSSQTAQHLPMTRAQRVASSRPRAGVAVSDIGMGAGLAVNSADDKYNYTTGTFVHNRPWQVRRPAISTATGGGTVTWLPPTYMGDGAITSYDLRHKIGAGSYTTVTGATSPATITGQPSGSLTIEIRANNANGNGPWTVMPAVSITGTGDVAPAVNVAGSISGNPYTTATLTSTAATFTGSPAPTVTRQWYKFTTATETDPLNGTALGTASTQAMTSAEEGFYIRCRTIGTNTVTSAYDMSAASARIGIAGLGQSINADGWSATYASPPTFNPTGAPEYVTVASPGFDSSGNATTQYRNIVWLKRIRQASPNQNTLSADQAAASDYIYSGDTVLGMTNNSALAAPLPIAMWLTPDLEIINSSTCTFALAVTHPFARNNLPVAQVEFSVTDGTTTLTQTVNVQSQTGYYVSGLAVPYYAGSIDISTLTQGATLTKSAKIKPWVGAEFDIAVHADAYPSPNLCVQKVLCNRTGGYGTAYAYVATTGNDGTGVTSTTAATAAASPYLTIAAAAAGIRTRNNSGTGYTARDNTSGGIIRIVAGDYTLASFSASQVDTTNFWPLTIEAADPALKTTTRLLTPAANTTTPAALTLRNFTIVQNSATVTTNCFNTNRSNQSYAAAYVCDSMEFDSNSLGAHTNMFVDCGRIWFINCSGPAGANGLGGQALNSNTATLTKAVTAIGCYGRFVDTATYHAIGCKVSVAKFASIPTTTANVAGVGQFLGWNFMSNGTDGANMIAVTTVTGARGMAICGNVVEMFGGITSPSVTISAASNTSAQQNIQYICNTVVGSRTDWLYNDSGVAAVIKTNSVNKFSVDWAWSMKTDTFPTADSNRTGNWSQIYRAGHRNCTTIRGGYDGVAIGGGGTGDHAWLGEVAALGAVNGSAGTPLTGLWVADRSATGAGGDGTGSGDYTPLVGSPIAKIPAGLAPWLCDLTGKPIDNTGAGWACANQR